MRYTPTIKSPKHTNDTNARFVKDIAVRHVNRDLMDLGRTAKLKENEKNPIDHEDIFRKMLLPVTRVILGWNVGLSYGAVYGVLAFSRTAQVNIILTNHILALLFIVRQYE